MKKVVSFCDLYPTERYNLNLLDSDPQDLVNKIKANDQLALQQLYQSNYYKVERYVVTNSGSIAQAKDIFQETFLAVWKNVRADKFIPQGSNALGGYLYRIAKNKWTDYLRSNKFKKTIKLVEKEVEIIPDEPTENFDKLDLAMKAFRELRLACKELLSKFYFDRLSFGEIAEELDLNPASLRNKKYRCLQQLRALALKDEF